jgi:hypothetical protein
VSWRYGDGYCGWAPLPPDSFVGVDYSDDGFDIGVGFHIGGDCDGFYGIGPGWYIFLPVNCLGYHSYHGYYHDRGDNYAIINHTTNVTNINVTRNGANAGVTTGGPMLAQVNAVSQTPVERVNLVRTRQPGGGGALTGNSLALYAPRVNPGATAQPSRVVGSVGQATINRGTDITQPLAVNARLAPAPATEAQVQQARMALDHAPASAKVVTDGASVRPILQAPLTSLKPVVREATPSSTFHTPPNTVSNTERAPSTQVVPTIRTYPQTGDEGSAPSRIYYPGTGGGSDFHPSVRPTAPAAPYSPASAYHSGGNSGGGGGSPNGGGASHTESGGGGGGGGYHGGGGSGGSGNPQGQGH